MKKGVFKVLLLFIITISIFNLDVVAEDTTVPAYGAYSYTDSTDSTIDSIDIEDLEDSDTAFSEVIDNSPTKNEITKDNDLYRISGKIITCPNNDKRTCFVVTANPQEGGWKVDDLKKLSDSNATIKFEIKIAEVINYKKNEKGDYVPSLDDSKFENTKGFLTMSYKEGVGWSVNNYVSQEFNCSDNDGDNNACNYILSVSLVKESDPTLINRGSNTVKREYESYLDAAYQNMYYFKTGNTNYNSKMPKTYACVSKNKHWKFEKPTADKANSSTYVRRVGVGYETSSHIYFNCNHTYNRRVRKANVQKDKKYVSEEGRVACATGKNTDNEGNFTGFSFNKDTNGNVIAFTDGQDVSNNTIAYINKYYNKGKDGEVEYNVTECVYNDFVRREDDNNQRSKLLKKYNFTVYLEFYASVYYEDEVQNANVIDPIYNQLVKNPYHNICKFLQGKMDLVVKQDNDTRPYQKPFITALKSTMGNYFENLKTEGNNNIISLKNNKLNVDFSIDAYGEDYKQLTANFCNYDFNNTSYLSNKVNDFLDSKYKRGGDDTVCKEIGDCIPRMMYPQNKDKFIQYLANVIYIMYISKYENSDANKVNNTKGDTQTDESVEKEDGTTINEIFESWKEKAGEISNPNDTKVLACSAKNVNFSDNTSYGTTNGKKNIFIVKAGSTSSSSASTCNNDNITYTSKSVVLDNQTKFLNESYFYYEETDTKEFDVNYTYNFEPSTQTGLTETDPRKKSVNQKVCTRKCGEVVKVAYYPPQIVQAGMCFSYRVRVSSYTKCEVYFENNDSPIDAFSNDDISDGTSGNTILSVVNAKPICYHTGGSIGMAAGPNEDFENCINSCDGGKYTESCSNYCYNEVYSSDDDNKKTSTNSSSAIIKKINSDFYKDSTGRTADTESVHEIIGDDLLSKPVSDSLRQCLEMNPEGCYYRDGNSIWWYATVDGWGAGDYTEKGKYKQNSGYYRYFLSNITNEKGNNKYRANINGKTLVNASYSSGKVTKDNNNMFNDIRGLSRFYMVRKVRPKIRSIYVSNGNTEVPKDAPYLKNTDDSYSDILKTYLSGNQVFVSFRKWDSGFSKLYKFSYESAGKSTRVALWGCSAKCSYAGDFTTNNSYINPYMYQNDLYENTKNLKAEINNCKASSICSMKTATFRIGTKYIEDDESSSSSSGIQQGSEYNNKTCSNKVTEVMYPYTEQSSKNKSSSCTDKVGSNNAKDVLCSTNNVEDRNGTYCNSSSKVSYKNNGSIIFGLGGCYYTSLPSPSEADTFTFKNINGEDEPVIKSESKIDNRYYLGEIGLPGVWRKSSKGSDYYVSTCYPKNSVGDYVYLSDRFCLNSTFVAANPSYYNKIVNDKTNKSTCSTCDYNEKNDPSKISSSCTKIVNSYDSKTSIDGYNIKAIIENFGRFGWNFNVYCFYSSSGNGYKIGDSSSNDKGSDNSNSCASCSCDKEKPFLQLRAVDNSNMFDDSSVATGSNTTTSSDTPTSDSNNKTTTSDSENVTKGYNWNLDLTDDIISEKELTNPKELISYIEKTEKLGKTYDTCNMDYNVVLTTKGIENLKDYLKNTNKNDYNAFKGKTKKVNGTLTYERALNLVGVTIKSNEKTNCVPKEEE